MITIIVGQGTGGGGDLTEFPPPQPLRLQEIQKEKKKGTLGTAVGYSPSLETRARYQ